MLCGLVVVPLEHVLMGFVGDASHSAGSLQTKLWSRGVSGLTLKEITGGEFKVFRASIRLQLSRPSIRLL